MAVYGYSRVSTDKQVEDGNSLPVQERQLSGWAMMQGTELACVFVEEGVSGSMPLGQRPQGRLLLEALEAGDIVVATKLDRVFRSALDALQITEQLAKRKVRFVLLDLGEVTDGLSKLFLTITAAFAEAERDRIRDRIRTAKRDGKQRGRYLGGKIPFGYRVDPQGALVEHEDEQAIAAHLKQLSQRMSIRKARLAVMEQHGCTMSLATAVKLAS